MPREHVYGNVVTVTDGDLPVLQARTVADLRALDPRVAPAAPADADVLRRRHQLLSQFVQGVRYALDAAPTGGEPARSAERNQTALADLRAQLGRLGDELAGLPLAVETNEGGDLTPLAPGARAVTRTGSTGRLLVADQTETRAVQLRATLSWTRDSGLVTLGITGHDRDRAEELDLGGPWLELDWVGANRLAREVKVARDHACGTPE